MKVSRKLPVAEPLYGMTHLKVKKEFLNDSCEKVFTAMSGNFTRITHNLKFDLCERSVHGNVPSIRLV